MGGSKEKIKVGSLNVNGVNEKKKEGRTVEQFEVSIMSVLKSSLQETHMLGDDMGGARVS